MRGANGNAGSRWCVACRRRGWGSGGNCGCMQLSPLSWPKAANVGSPSGWRVVLAPPCERTLAIGFLFTGVTAVAAGATLLELSKGLVADRTGLFLKGHLASSRHFVEELAALGSHLWLWMR